MLRFTNRIILDVYLLSNRRGCSIIDTEDLSIPLQLNIQVAVQKCCQSCLYIDLKLKRTCLTVCRAGRNKKADLVQFYLLTLVIRWVERQLCTVTETDCLQPRRLADINFDLPLDAASFRKVFFMLNYIHRCNIFVTGSCVRLLYYSRCLERIKCCFEQALGTRLVILLLVCVNHITQRLNIHFPVVCLPLLTAD